MGEETRIYYGAWDPRGWEGSPPRGGVGIATLPRDRFAELMVDPTTTGSGNYQMQTTVSSFLTSALRVEGAPQRFFVNADGLGPDAMLKIELLDHRLQPLENYSGTQAAVVRTSGFQTPIVWNGKAALTDLPDRIRLRVTFAGAKKFDLRFSALYVQ